jgi:hypothetical protein
MALEEMTGIKSAFTKLASEQSMAFYLDKISNSL